MKKFGKIILRIFIGLFAFILLILTLFAIFQKKIIVYAINKGIESFDPTITTGDIEVSNLWDYPEMIVQIDRANIPGTLPRETAPLLNCKHLEVHVNLAKILTGQLIIDKVYLQEPNVKIRINEKGQTNFDFGKDEPQPEEQEESNPPEITVREIIISQASVQADIDTSNQHLQILIDTLHTPLTYNADRIDCRPYLHLLTKKVQLDSLHILENRPVALEGGIGFRFDNTQLLLDSTFLSLDEQKFLFDGQFTADSIPYINMTGMIYPDTLKDFLDLVPPAYLSVLDTIEVEGIIGAAFQAKGKLDTTGLPFVTVGLDFDQGRVAIPSQGIEIEHLQFNTRFTTGERKNLSDAFLSVQNLAFRYNNNPVSGTIEAQNLQNPDLNVHLKALANLSTFQAQLKEQGVELLQGRLNCDVHYMGNLNALKALKTLPKGHIRLDDLHIKHAQYPHQIDIDTVHIDFKPEVLTVNTKNIKVGKSSVLRFQTALQRPLAVYQEQQPVRASLSIIAPFLDIDELSGTEPKQEEAPKQIKNLVVETRVDFMPKMLTDSTAEKDIKLYLTRFHFEHDTLQQNFYLRSGKIHLQENDLSIEDLYGTSDDTDFSIDLDVANLAAFQKEEADTFTIQFGIKSKYLDLKKLSWGQVEMYPIKDLDLNFNLQASNQWMHMPEGQKLTYLILKFGKLNGLFYPYQAPLSIDDFNLLVQQGLIDLQGFIMQYKESDLHADLNIKKPEALMDKKYHEADIYARIKSKKLNLDQLAFLWKKDSTTVEKEKTDEEDIEEIEKDTVLLDSSRVRKLPTMDIEVDIADISYQGGHTDLVHTMIKTKSDKIIMVDPFQVLTGKGNINGTGVIELLPNGQTEFVNNFKVDSINISDLVGNLEEESDLKMYGKIQGDLTSRLLFSPYGSFMMDSSRAVIKFEVDDGRIVNFDPFIALALFFKTSEMRDLKFEKMVNIIDFDGEYLYIPGMWIKTNAGDIFVSGKQSIDGEMDYHVALPFSLLNTMPVNFINEMPKTMMVDMPQKVLNSGEGSIIFKIVEAVKLNMLRDATNKTLAGVEDDEIIKDENGEYVSVTDTEIVNAQLMLRITGKGDDIDVGYDTGGVLQKWKRTLVENPQNWMQTFEEQDPEAFK